MNNHLETVAAVSAVVSAFHGGADLVKQIRKRSKKRKGEQFVKEKLLQEALEAGEVQISQRYTTHHDEMGAQFRIGDAIGRERLLHIAVVMQSELIRSLQIALQYDNAVLDLTKLQEDAFMSRRDTLTCLDELRSRLAQNSRSQDTAASYMQTLPRRPSLESVRTHMTSQTVSSDFVPAGVKIPEEEESRGSISRLLSMRRSPKKLPESPSSRASLLPSFDWLGPAIRPEEHPATRQTEYELPAADVQRPLSDPNYQYLHPATAKDHPITRHVSTTSSTSTTTSRSDFSDEKIPVLLEEEEAVSPATAVEIAGALPPQHYYQHNHSRFPSSSNNSIMSPTSTISTTSPLPSPTIAIAPDPIFAFRRRSVARPISSSTSNRSSSYSHRTSSISMPSTASSGPAVMLGRPSKDNNYWGFCKGAWTCREDWRKGLQIQQIPSGMYSSTSVWRCKHCSFEGQVYGAKKPYDVDKRIFVAKESGVQYRFLFLAKSHVKRKQGKDDTTCFGCVVCVAEGNGTSIFGNMETLCNHLVVEHSKGSMSEDMQKKNKCIVGRNPNPGEDFDFCIPAPAVVVDEHADPNVVRFSREVEGSRFA